MARRLEIARGMLHTPRVLFLDEPTVGLDPQTRALIWEDIHRLRREEGVTIFLTTHYMDEAENAERIAIIDYGEIIALDTPDALKASVGRDTVALETADDAAALSALRAAGYQVERTEGGLTVYVDDEEAAVGPLVAVAGVPVRTVRAHRPTLDDVFLHYTGPRDPRAAWRGRGADVRPGAWRPSAMRRWYRNDHDHRNGGGRRQLR